MVAKHIESSYRKQAPAWHGVMDPTVPGLTPDDPAEVDQGIRLEDTEPRPEPPLADWRQVPIPPRMRHLKKDHRGYPIFFAIQPYGVPITEGMHTDFRVLNTDNHERCARFRLCGVCGRRIGPVLYFCGGPMCVQNRAFGDSPMHGECARYAMRVCPHLTIASKGYSMRPIQGQRATETDPNLSLTKPQRIVLYACKEYVLHKPPRGKGIYVVPPAEWVEWFQTDGRYVCRTRPTRYAQ